MTGRGNALQTRTILIGLAFGALVALTPTAQAQAPQDPAACAAIAGNTERLACYDAIFRIVTGDIELEPVVISSERLIPARPTGREPATLTVSCPAGGLDVSFSFAGQLVSNTGDIAPITLQVDQNATAVRTLRADADNTSLRFSTSADAAAFLDSLAGGTNLKVRVTPVRMRSLTVDFRLLGSVDAIAALRAGCPTP